MKSVVRYRLSLVLVAVLSACGGHQDSRDTGTPAALAARASSAAKSAPLGNGDYDNVLQAIYVAYFGRPADPAGLAYFANAYRLAGAPTSVVGVNQAYGSNAELKSLIDSFGTSDESRALYPGDNASFINAIYLNLFNRPAEAGGVAYWAGAVDRNEITRANAALSIMAGAQGSDATIINNKIAVATSFMLSLTTPQLSGAYSGLAANVVARDLLGRVAANTDAAGFGPLIDASNGALQALQASRTAAVLTGTAAVGAALAGANVAVTDAGGTAVCAEAAIVTSALGGFSCTLKAGAVAPLFVVVTDPSGNTAPLASVAMTTPLAGTPVAVNVTPLTTVILGQLAGDTNALTLVRAGVIDKVALQATTSKVVAQLATVLGSIGGPAAYDPFGSALNVASEGRAGNPADLLLDLVRPVIDPASGKLALATLGAPTPVLLASATVNGALLTAPAAGAAALPQAAQIIGKTFTSCFAQPSARRVLARNDANPVNQGGAEVTSLGGDCANLAANGANAGGMVYRHNGYRIGQALYSQLTSDAMTGAVFASADVIAYYPATGAGGVDQATVVLKYVDGAGNPASLLTTARALTGTSSVARPTVWWLVGNQDAVDVAPILNLRRAEQLNPNSTAARAGAIQTGIQFGVNVIGPGSVLDGKQLTLARVSGPGLPGNGAAGTGLVYKVSTQPGQRLMDLFNKTGSLTSGLQCGNGVLFNCPIVWYQRSLGVSGTAATTLGTNLTTAQWIQPADVVAGADIGKLVKGTRYTIELFYGSNVTSADVVVVKTLVGDLVPAVNASGQAWDLLGPQSLKALDPNGGLAGAQTALVVDWIPNSAALQVNGVTALIDSSGAFGLSKPVALGASSVVLDNLTVPAFSSAATRTLFLSYRTFDGSIKSATFSYN